MTTQRIEKPWGYELLWAHTPHYAGKILAIRSGCQLSLQLHERKEESMYLLSGTLEVELEGEDGQILCHQARRGETFDVPARRRHRLRALTACRVLEVSTPELEDIIRFQDDYGRTEETTTPAFDCVSPRISIVIPAFNAERYLEQTINSVLAQTISDWELIIADDGSSDSTAAVALASARRDPRIRVIRQQNQGIAGARNRGFAESSATAEFVIFLDHDDLWGTDALATLVGALEANPAAVAASGLSCCLNAAGKPVLPGELEVWGRRRQGVVGKRLMAWPEHAPTTLAVLAYRNYIRTAGQVLIRRAALEAAGPFAPAAVPCDDWDLWLRLSQWGEIAYVDQVVLGWRSHSQNTSRQQALMARQTAAVRRKLLTSPDLSPEQRRIVRQASRFAERENGRFWLRAAAASLARGQLRRAARQFRNAVKSYGRAMRPP